jgi:UDP-glucose 4-epimerase
MLKNFKNAKVLIAGGLGFIGSNLARRLAGLNAKVTLIDSLVPEHGGNLFNIAEIKGKVAVNISDVRNTQELRGVVKGQDYLFNFAGQTSHLDSMRDPYTDLEMNCRAQLSILEACRNYNPDIKIVFASTRQIYGKPKYLPVDEGHPIQPVDINGINKIAGEQYHILYNNVYGIRCCVLRLTNTYGPHMRIKDGRQTFVGLWIRSLIENKPFEVWDGKQLRDFNYIDDVVDAMLLAAVDNSADGEIFNLGAGDVINLKELAELLMEVNGQGKYIIKPFPASRKKIDIGDYYSNFKKIQYILGWKPKITLRNGFISTLDFYRKNLSRYI